MLIRMRWWRNKYHQRWFRWTSNSNQGSVSNINFLYPKRYNELFLCFSNNDVVDQVENILKGYTYSLRMKNMDILFAGDLDDYRYTGFYNKTTLTYGSQRYATWLRFFRGNFFRGAGPVTVIARDPGFRDVPYPDRIFIEQKTGKRKQSSCLILCGQAVGQKRS